MGPRSSRSSSPRRTTRFFPPPSSMIDFVCVPSWYTQRVFCARVFSRVSLALFSSLITPHKQTNFEQAFCSTKTHAFRPQNRLNRLLITKSIGRECCFRRKNQTFCGTLILLSHLFFFVFFLFERFLFERERERHFFVSARERANALGRTQRERERFVFNKRKCPPPRNKNGNKINSLF